MAHRALTLKYRPQVFADLIGQDHVSEVLSRALEGGRVAHAYLFTGARGVGKTTSARILAKALNCEQRLSGKLKGADPCNVCTSCTEITSGISLDVTEIDGASNRGIADVQALRERVRFSPTGGGHRVVIIDEVHQLSNDAFAALLKTLEEPPPHLVFLFATTDPQKLPDTIRSRTQRFDFARVALRKVADRLLEIARREQADPEGVKFTLSEGAALLIAHKSEGSMRDAVSALDQVVSAGESEIREDLVRRVLGIADREAFFAIADGIVRHDPKGALHALHQAFEKGIDPKELAEGLCEHVRALLVLKVDPAGADLVAASGEELARLLKQGEGWADADLLRLLRITSDVQWPMRDSPHPLVHLEAAVLQMATLEPGETLGRVLERLEALERRLAGGGAAPSTPPARSATPASAPRTAEPARGSPPAKPGTPPRGSAIAQAVVAGGGGLPDDSRGPVAPRRHPNDLTALQPHSPSGSPPPPAVATAPVAGAAAPVAVATAAAAATATLVVEMDAAVEAAWQQTLEAVSGRKKLLGAFLKESRLVGLSGPAVIVAMDDLHRAVVDEKENRQIVAEELRRGFGRALEMQCVPLDAAELAQRRPTQESVKPMIDKAIEWFEGDIIERGGRDAERKNG